MELKDWRKKNEAQLKKGMELELPCCLTVYVRTIKPADFFHEFGRIPDSLTPLVTQMITGKDLNVDEIGLDKALSAQDEFKNAICRLAIVSPRIIDSADEPGDDELLLSELDDEDKEFLTGLLGLPARKLESFCQNQARNLADSRKREALESASEPDAEPAAVLP